MTETESACRVCGCTWNSACYLPGVGACWWVDETETLCSHCEIKGEYDVC